MWRARSLVGGQGDELKRRMLFFSLAALLFLYGLAALTSYLVDVPRTDGRGELLACAAAALGLLLIARPHPGVRRQAVTMVCLVAAPILSLLFHRAIEAQVWSVVPLMFAAIFIRTWYPPVTARIATAGLIGAAIGALLIAPVAVPELWLVIYAVSILGAQEVFGIITSALIEAAFRDPLTSVWNRTGVDEHARLLTEHARRTRKPLAIMVFDVDDFKMVNDMHGHPAGDAVLVQVAGQLAERAPERSVLGRIGGDEFVVIAAGHDLASAQRLAAELAAGHQVAVSFGVAAGDPRYEDVRALFAGADDDLYRRKRLRR
jgi:diguanylate cyclase (GGDEF)-like protein